MENQKKKEKMKLSDKIITTIILLALLAGGGYYLYKHFVIDARNIDIPDVEGIETCEIWTNDDWSSKDGYYELMEMVSAMEKSDANFFIGEAHPEYEHFLSISQTDKATFEDTMEKVSSADVAQRTIDDMKMVFDANFGKITDGMEDFQYEAMEEYDGFPVVQGDNSMQYNLGDEGLALYLVEHEVSLKCESIKIDKVAAANFYGDGGFNEVALICAMGTAEVTTESANGDISEIGLFGNAGETVTIRFSSKGSMSLSSQLPGLTHVFTMERAE